MHALPPRSEGWLGGRIRRKEEGGHLEKERYREGGRSVCVCERKRGGGGHVVVIVCMCTCTHTWSTCGVVYLQYIAFVTISKLSMYTFSFSLIRVFLTLCTLLCLASHQPPSSIQYLWRVEPSNTSVEIHTHTHVSLVL